MALPFGQPLRPGMGARPVQGTQAEGPDHRRKIHTYRFADYKERVIDLLQRVCTVSVQTMDVVDGMAYWEGDHLIVYGDRDHYEWSMLGLAEMARRNDDEDEEWLAAWQAAAERLET